ncbi:RCC1 and BTB domain-containing protein 1 [Camponotus japonicus]
MQEYENRILQCVLAEKITPMDLKNWMLFHLLKPEFISQIHMFLVYNSHESIIVMKDKNVYSLYYSEKDHLHTAIYPKKIKKLCGKNIKTFANGDFFILALTEEGEVYYWQSRIRKIIIKTPHIPVMLIPTRVADLRKKRVVDIACGKYHYLALTSDEKVYAWGENNYKRFFDEDLDSFDSMPRQVKHELENKNVIHIACGLKFNIVITDENKIYGWGNNFMGQISIDPSRKYYMYPHEIITISDKIVKVTCGYDHTLALTNKGKIYAWGNNKYGQIGVNKEIKHSGPIMVNVPAMGKVLNIAALGDLSVAVGYDRIIYVWGNFYYEPIFVPFPTKFSRIHDAIAYSNYKFLSKPLTVFTNNYKYVEEVLNILESVGAAFDNPLTSDFTVQVEGQPIYVHKVILKIRCDYFKKMFQHDWVENIQSISDSSPVFTVSDKFSYIVYKAFLKYLYTGTIDLPSENALELLELADMYCETNLIKDCSQIIQQAITVLNVAFFYNKAIKYNAKELEEFCSQFALRHMTADTLLQDIKLDMNMQAKFMQKAVTQSRDTIVSMSSKKFCSLEDVEKRNLTTDKEDKMQKYDKRILQCVLAEKIISMNLKNWPVFRLLKPEFILQIHMVMIFDGPGERAIIVTKDKNVYILDFNSMINDIHTAIYPKKIKELYGKNIKKFARGEFFILALTEEGEVYFCDLAGKKKDDEVYLYPTMSIPEESTFIQVAGLSEKRIVDIACGRYHCLALTSDGKVYSWGDNDYWQTVDKDITTFDSVPRQVKHELENKNVIHIACGLKFNIVITDENKIYSWGNNFEGQISTAQSRKYYMHPRKIKNISDKIVKVTCGYDHTLTLTNKGKIYAWGNNSYGQIGVNKNYNELECCGPIMVNVPEMGKVLDIAALCYLSVAVGYDRIIYVWGHFCSEHIFVPFPTKFSRIHDAIAYSGYRLLWEPLTVFTNNYKYVEEELNILESVGAAFDDPLTSDFTVQVEGQPIYVHKAILKIRCDYFKKMFQHNWAKNIQSISDSSPVFTVSDKFSYIVYKAFLKYLYTGTIDLPSENALELMELADMYCETNLIKDCSQIVEKAISVSNVAFFYNKAIECNAKELEEFCFQFALRHMTDVILSEDYIKLDINIKNNFMRRAAKENAFKMYIHSCIYTRVSL